MNIPSRVETEAVICCLWPLGMCHSKLSEIQPGKKFLAVYNGETLPFSRLRVGLKGWQVGTINRNVVECVIQEEQKRNHPTVFRLIKELSELEICGDVHSTWLQVVPIHAVALRNVWVFSITWIVFKICNTQGMVLKEPIGNVTRHNIPKEVAKEGRLSFSRSSSSRVRLSTSPGLQQVLMSIPVGIPMSNVTHRSRSPAAMDR